MAWFEFHQSLVTHKKLYALAGRLNVSRATAAGHLAFLWAWALDNAPSGSLDGVDANMIKLAADWPKKGETFVEACVASGFIDRAEDGSLTLHDWWDYAGRLLDKRQKDADRKRMLRGPSSGVSIGHPPDIRRTGAGHPPDGRMDGARTVPNRTVPNQDQEDLSRARARGALGWWRQLTHREPPNSAMREILANLDAAHPPECIDWAFERAASADEPWPYAKRLLDECAVVNQHGPRQNPNRRAHASTAKPATRRRVLPGPDDWQDSS